MRRAAQRIGRRVITMTSLPNPFASAVPQAVESAVASSVHTPGTVDATAEPSRFVLDEAAFMEAIEPLPLFLQAPIAVLDVLAGY